MYPVLKARLEQTLTPERLYAFVEADSALQAVGFEDHLVELQQMEGLQESADPATFIDNVEVIYRTAIDAVLKQFGIHCDTSAPMHFLQDALSAVLQLDNYDDTDRLFSITDDSNHPQEALGELLELTGQYDCAHYMTLLTYVTQDLIDRIHAINSPNPDSGPSEQLRERVRTRLKEFLEHYRQEAPLWVETLIYVDRMGLAMPPSFYFNDATLAAILELPAPRQAIECVGLMLASNYATHAFRRFILAQMDGRFDEPLKLTQLDVELGKLLKVAV